MRYRVTFAERFGADGEQTQNPPAFLDLNDGVVVDSVFITREEPPNLHGQETMDEDDDFMSRGSETWEYEVAEGRDEEFLLALKNSGMVMEYEVLDTVPGLE